MLKITVKASGVRYLCRSLVFKFSLPHFGSFCEQELVLYDRELLNRPKLLIVTKLDKKGATGRFQELQRKLQTIQQHGKFYPVYKLFTLFCPLVINKDTVHGEVC